MVRVNKFRWTFEYHDWTRLFKQKESLLDTAYSVLGQKCSRENEPLDDFELIDNIYVNKEGKGILIIEIWKK